MGIFNFLKKSESITNSFRNDSSFDRLYPDVIRSLSKPHWTPLVVARAAAKFLAETGSAKVLDIGSGVGKFCLAAAHYEPSCHFYGVEQRQHLIDHAETARRRLQLDNVSFIHQNLTAINFGEYNHFYFFNSFYENLREADKIDYLLDYSEELYASYNNHLYDALRFLPSATRLCTYFGSGMRVPPSFELVGISFNEKLRFWIKR